MSEKLNFFKRPESITNVVEDRNYDVVVIGAGSPGVPCALRAAELGAKVAILQKESEAAACGNFGAGIISDTSDPADIEKCVSLLMSRSDHRAKRALLEMWAHRSGEAVKWTIDRAKEAGAQVTDMGTAAHGALLKKTGWNLNFVTCVFGPKPYDTGEAMKAMCVLAEKKGVDVFYNTPAVQLEQESNNAVTGVIAKVAGGYIRFNATKGVVVATGDYANDKAMMNYYLPDMQYMDLKRTGRTGDGHKMIVWAGGKMENVGHTKMVHDMDSGSTTVMSAPYLRVKFNGKRFCDETVGMEYMNCYLNGKEDRGHYFQILSSRYVEQATAMGLHVDDPKTLRNWMPEEKIERHGVVESLINTYRADTLEELAQKLGIKDIPAFLRTVREYNEMALNGRDIAFGTPAEKMCPVEQGPFYGVHRHVRFTVGCSGVIINERMECLDENENPIPGLYAIGNLAGNFYGSVDYPLDVFGLNLGHNYTEGYVVAEEVVKR